MIFIYPMLTSSDISPNITPAICKALEQFILLYGIDDNITKAAKRSVGAKAMKVGSKLIWHENEVFEQTPAKLITNKSVAKAAGELVKAEPSKIKTKIEMPSHDSLSLEPTYVQIESAKGPEILGIKVIPFPVKGKVSMTRLMLDDRKRKALEYVVAKYDRKVSRLFYRLCRFLPTIRNKALTGDPKQDILFASTRYTDHTFALLNFMDLADEQIFKDPSKVQKLQKLGWGSYIIADDVNKRAIFCMKQFGGLCSTVPYSYMLASFKKGKYYEVYKDLEDVKKTASPFFSMKTTPKRLVGESCAYNKKEEYQKLKKKLVDEQKEVITEDIKSVIKSLTSGETFKKVLSNVEFASKTKDPEKIKRSLKIIPKIPFSKVEKFCKKLSPNFEYSYNIAKKVLTNSTSIPKNLVAPSACIIALNSTYKNDNYKQATKMNLQNAVSEIRKIKTRTESELVQEFDPESIVNFVDYIAKLIIKIFESQVMKGAHGIETGIRVGAAGTGLLSTIWASIPTTPVIIVLAIITLIILAYLVETA